jgi:hypothetical protein
MIDNFKVTVLPISAWQSSCQAIYQLNAAGEGDLIDPKKLLGMTIVDFQFVDNKLVLELQPPQLLFSSK